MLLSIAKRQVTRTLPRARQTLAAIHSAATERPLKISTIPAPHTGEITVVSLNRPKARNAISRQLLAELKGVVDQVHSEGENGSTRALILTSESDDAFCAGADLKERLTFTEDEYAVPLEPTPAHHC